MLLGFNHSCFSQIPLKSLDCFGKPYCPKKITQSSTLDFYPDRVLPILSHFVKAGYFVLFSANLATGTYLLQVIQQKLPQHDNELTKDWPIAIFNAAGEVKAALKIFTLI